MRACAALLASSSVPSLRRHADLLDRFLQGRDGETFEEIAGLSPRAGEKSWRALLEHEIVDQALKAAEILISPPHLGLGRPARLQQLRRELRTYERRWLRFDRFLELMPGQYYGTVDAHLFAAFKANQRLGRNDFPMSDSELRRILSD
jgi:hypothetical protein